MNVQFPQNMHKVGQSTNMVFIWSSSHTKKTQSHRISSCMWCHFNAVSKERSEEKWKMFHRYFLLQSYQLAEENFLLTSKQDKLKHPINKVMTIPTQASEMRQKEQQITNKGTSFFNIQALPCYINAQLSTNIKWSGQVQNKTMLKCTIPQLQ